jgi:hypothetical protein
MGPDAISWERALEIATTHLAGQIGRRFECYIKILSPTITDARAYWYVHFVTTNLDSFFAVIDGAGNIIN